MPELQERDEHAEAKVAELFGSADKILVISYANPPKGWRKIEHMNILRGARKRW